MCPLVEIDILCILVSGQDHADVATFMEKYLFNLIPIKIEVLLFRNNIGLKKRANPCDEAATLLLKKFDILISLLVNIGGQFNLQLRRCQLSNEFVHLFYISIFAHIQRLFDFGV